MTDINAENECKRLKAKAENCDIVRHSIMKLQDSYSRITEELGHCSYMRGITDLFGDKNNVEVLLAQALDGKVRMDYYVGNDNLPLLGREKEKIHRYLLKSAVSDFKQALYNITAEDYIDGFQAYKGYLLENEAQTNANAHFFEANSEYRRQERIVAGTEEPSAEHDDSKPKTLAEAKSNLSNAEKNARLTALLQKHFEEMQGLLAQGKNRDSLYALYGDKNYCDKMFTDVLNGKKSIDEFEEMFHLEERPLPFFRKQREKYRRTSIEAAHKKVLYCLQELAKEPVPDYLKSSLLSSKNLNLARKDYIKAQSDHDDFVQKNATTNTATANAPEHTVAFNKSNLKTSLKDDTKKLYEPQVKETPVSERKTENSASRVNIPTSSRTME